MKKSLPSLPTPPTPTSLPPPSPPSHPFLRRRIGSSSTSTTTSSSSSSSSSFPSPSPSPSHLRFRSPLHPSSSIPFSWEHQPGIPKNPNPSLPLPLPLPLPPPLRSSPSPRSKKRPDVDPFAAALQECARTAARPPDDELEQLWSNPASAGRRRRTAAAAAIARRIAVLDLHGSCKAACSVTESTVYVRRTTGSYGLLNLRPGPR